MRIQQPFAEEAVAAFGISPDESLALLEWLGERVGFVFGDRGRGGSGVFVELDDGSTALLTARHVAIGAILSGEITVGHSHLGPSDRSLEPSQIRIEPRVDAALIVLPNMQGLPRMSRSDWNPETAPEIRNEQVAISAGAPGEWKSEPDASQRTIELVKTLFFLTRIIEASEQKLIVCDVYESTPLLPRSFRGISGGPVIDTQRRLIGINCAERRADVDGRLYVTPRASWTDLYEPFVVPIDAPTDYVGDCMVLSIMAKHEEANAAEPPVRVIFIAKFFWSLSRTDHRYGSFGQVVSISFGTAALSAQNTVFTNSLFFPLHHDKQERIRALTEEAQFFLSSLKFKAVDESTTSMQ